MHVALVEKQIRYLSLLLMNPAHALIPSSPPFADPISGSKDRCHASHPALLPNIRAPKPDLSPCRAPPIGQGNELCACKLAEPPGPPAIY
jgi:hypothetical protein